MKSRHWYEITTQNKVMAAVQGRPLRDERLAMKPLADSPAPKLMMGWPVQRRTVTWDDRHSSINLYLVCVWGNTRSH